MANGLQFLEFLVQKEYLPTITAKRHESPDLEHVIDNMFKTELFTEEKLVAYLNEWEQCGVELIEVGKREISIPTDVVENHSRLAEYLVTPVELLTMTGGSSLTGGGSIKFTVPFKYMNVVTKDHIRRSLKGIHQTSAWRIDIIYCLTEPAASTYYKYAKKFIDSTLKESESLTLRQKIMKIFRDSVNSDTMDIVFNRRGREVTILRKYMSEFHPYEDVKISDSEIDSLKNMLVGTIGNVEALKVNSEPNIGFKIENLVEDGNYEGRVDFMETKEGYQIHIRIIKLGYNKMMLEDYYLSPKVKKDVQESLEEKTGLILVTGPRGSGKQVFTYTMINEYVKRNPYSFIETLEDPVEARLEGNIAQIEIEDLKGYDFNYYSKGLKRHSSNLYFYGELRDLETAEAIALESSSAALVISTTHCADCAGSFKKLSMELKGDDDLLVKLINEFKVVTNLTMGREACPKCGTVHEYDQLTNSQKAFVDSWNYKGRLFVATPGGCDSCRTFNYERVNKLESDGSLFKPLVIVESLKFDHDIIELINLYQTITDKENAVRKHMIKENRYKTQLALGLVNAGKLTLNECMKLFSPNYYTKG